MCGKLGGAELRSLVRIVYPPFARSLRSERERPGRRGNFRGKFMSLHIGRAAAPGTQYPVEWRLKLPLSTCPSVTFNIGEAPRARARGAETRIPLTRLDCGRENRRWRSTRNAPACVPIARGSESSITNVSRAFSPPPRPRTCAFLSLRIADLLSTKRFYYFGPWLFLAYFEHSRFFIFNFLRATIFFRMYRLGPSDI